LGIAVYCGAETIAKIAKPSPLYASTQLPGSKPTEDPRREQIKAIDDQIRSLREQFRSQTDPIEAQLKALREKFEADLQALQAHRKTLVEQGEPPALKDLNDEETSQLAALDDQEKAEIEKVHQHFSDEKKTLKESFQQRRHDLAGGKK
jgi:F0F1-type ATP synthase membrane subunit b/b'